MKKMTDKIAETEQIEIENDNSNKNGLNILKDIMEKYKENMVKQGNKFMTMSFSGIVLLIGVPIFIAKILRLGYGLPSLSECAAIIGSTLIFATSVYEYSKLSSEENNIEQESTNVMENGIMLDSSLEFSFYEGNLINEMHFNKDGEAFRSSMLYKDKEIEISEQVYDLGNKTFEWRNKKTGEREFITDEQYYTMADFMYDQEDFSKEFEI